MKTGKKHQLAVLIETVNHTIDTQSIFARLTGDGQKRGTILYERDRDGSAFSGLSIGVINSSVVIEGKGDGFSLKALDALGSFLLPVIIEHFPTQTILDECSPKRVRGRLVAQNECYDINDRLSAINHMDLIRSMQCNVNLPEGYEDLPVGLYGCFGFDFVRQFEKIPKCHDDRLNDPDYVFYLGTTLFVCDDEKGKTDLISLYPELADDAVISAQHMVLKDMKESITNVNIRKKRKIELGKMESDTTQSAFYQSVDAIKEAIFNGDAFQVVYGRMFEASFKGNPFDVYQCLKSINPSPYHFFMQDEYGTLVGASPELALRVASKNQSTQVEIHPIAGTRARGIVNGVIDERIDQRNAIALKTDPKELAEHTMLIDLARNDIASIAKPGTTKVINAYDIEKFARVQHLVSKVCGELDNRFDALTAYLATMNMGTLTGAPKPSALALIAKYEKNARGFFGGGFGFITHHNALETSIVIRSMRFRDGKVFIRAGAGIVADSIPENEYKETQAKAASCINALNQLMKEKVCEHE